jgi:hypothetical protein
VGLTRARDGDGRESSSRMFASYYHYFGGMADVVDYSFQVKGVEGLYVSDGSVLRRLTAFRVSGFWRELEAWNRSILASQER